MKLKKAFTLLEVIIVVIIIGVLAALALPRFSQLIEGVRAAEAMSELGKIRQAMERYYLMSEGTYIGAMFDSQNTFYNNLDIDVPSPGAHFIYKVTALNKEGFGIIAWRNTVDGGQSGEVIFMGKGTHGHAIPGGGVSFGPGDYPNDGKIYWDAAPVYKGMIPKTE